jgi:outer membrane receptor for ferrienterochelin and colicins
MSDRVRLRLNATVTEFSRNEVPTGFSINGAAGTINSFLAALSADTHTGVWTARAYTNKLDVASVPTPALPNSFNFLNRVTVAQLEDVFTLGSAHTLRGAVEYRHNTVNTTPVSGGEISYDVYAAAGMWNWRITPALSLTNAVRYDQLQLERSGSLAPGFPLPNAAWNRTIAETSFNSGLVWRASERDTFRAMVSRGVQLPNLTHLGAVVIVTPFYNVSGGPFINPSATTNYELTWDHDLESLGAQVRTAIFYEDNKNMTGTEGGVIAGPGGVFLGATNVGDSQAVGLEIGLKGEIADAWRWSVDYRAEAIDDDFAPPDPIRGTTTNYEDTTPEHLINASLGWSGGRWEADGFVRYQSDVSGVLPGAGAAPASLTPIDAYAALDGRVAYRLTDRATFAVSGQNLGTAEQRQTSAPEVERRIMGTLSFNY